MLVMVEFSQMTSIASLSAYIPQISTPAVNRKDGMDGRVLILLKGCESDLICRELSAQEAPPHQQSYDRSSTSQAGWEEEDESCDSIMVVKKHQADTLVKNLRDSWEVINFVSTFA